MGALCCCFSKTPYSVTDLVKGLKSMNVSPNESILDGAGNPTLCRAIFDITGVDILNSLSCPDMGYNEVNIYLGSQIIKLSKKDDIWILAEPIPLFKTEGGKCTLGIYVGVKHSTHVRNPSIPKLSKICYTFYNLDVNLRNTFKDTCISSNGLLFSNKGIL